VKHSSARDYSCETCQHTVKFKTEASLKAHIRTIHNNSECKEKLFKCSFCDRAYYHERHLKYHNRKHVVDKRYKCELCDEFFYYSDAVKWHKIRFHGEPAPYPCSFPNCTKKFIHEKSLQTHLIEHQTSSKSVQCPICKKSVSEKRHLKRHMRGHEEKEFNCKCGESFKERHQLTKYIRFKSS
jgi:uncharacterized Zn-finger protein